MQTDVYEKEIIFQNIKESNFVLLDEYKEKDPNQNEKTYIIIGFKNTIIIIDKSSFSILQPLFSSNENLIFCFLSDINGIKFAKINEINSQMKNDINTFNKKLVIHSSYGKEIIKIWNAIIPCISGYLLKESYEKNKINRLKNFLTNEDFNSNSNFEIINENEFIELRQIGMGSSFKVDLIYHIEKGELFALKKTYLTSNSENEKLTHREIENHTKICSPLMPKFIGTNKNKEYIIMEFINGKLLSDIHINQLSYNDKMTIIFEIMMNIEFLHRKKFILRELKPSNIMLDHNNTAILIDFDRIRKNDEDTENFTNDFSSIFVAPEVNSGEFSFESDIYSLGLIMFYIIKSEKPTIENLKNFIHSDQDDFIKIIIRLCTKEYPTDRPLILEIIFLFFNNCHTYIKIENLFEQYITKLIKYYKLDEQNDNIDYSEEQYNIGMIYFEGKIVPQNIEKAIHYLKLAAKNDLLDAQFNLGAIYSDGKFIVPDIKKAIYYFTLAANQNDSDAQYNLGLIYSDGKLIQCDIEKAIHYYLLAANQNNSEAQFKLGLIYENGKLIPCDIEKAIYYYSLAANNNNSSALFNLGLMYLNGKHIKCDVEKAIHYFTLAANQKFIQAQYHLGMIYINNKFVERDVNKAIYYLSLAADQNDSDAQYNLGVLYLNNEFITRNINKAIRYLTSAANQNNPMALFNLGAIYTGGMSIRRDIEKGIYYYKLAANQNISDAQFNLGIIFAKGEFIVQDVDKAIYYFTLAANQNHSYSQYCLGVIYLEKNYNKHDITKAIHFFKLAANNNVSEAYLNLGVIYENGISIQCNINKAIHYYLQAANLSNSDAIFELGYIYYTGNHVTIDYIKAIHYFSLAASLKHKRAMYIMGILNLDGFFVPKNNIKASNFLLQSVNDEDKNSYFTIGYLYHMGIVYNQDIHESIKYYKEASTFNNPCAKNNLGVIYKRGFGEVVTKELARAVIYFKEAIDLNNDKMAMYNLAHLYFYEELYQNCIDESIKLLIKLSKENFYPSKLLLCLISITNFGSEYKDIINELNKYGYISCELKKSIHDILTKGKLEYIDVFEDYFNKLRDIDFIYDHHRNAKTLVHAKLATNDQKREFDKNNSSDINSEFYEGFGFDLLK